MKTIKLMVKQVVTYKVEVEVEVPDEMDVDKLSDKFSDIVRRHSDEFPDDAAHVLSDSVEGVKIIDAPRYDQYKNDADDWEMEYYGDYKVVKSGGME